MTLLRTTRGGKAVEFALANGGVLLGTAPGCQIVVADPAVAPKHCKIVRSPQGFVVTDLSGGGGTIVNGTKVKEHVLKHGDVLQVGSEKFTFAEKKEEPVAAAAKAPAPAVKVGAGGGTPAPAGGRRALPPRPAASGARAPTARRMTPKPGAVARIQKSQSVFVLPSTRKGKAIAISVAVGIVVLAGVLFVISAGTKSSEQVKKLALEDMKKLAAIPETDYEKRLELIDAILANPDYGIYAPAEIQGAHKDRVVVAKRVDLQKRANTFARSFIEKFKSLKNGPVEDFKRQWDGLYDEVKVLLDDYAGTTFEADLTAIKAELKELMEKVGPGWIEESPKLANTVQKQIDLHNYNQALVEVDAFAARFKDVNSTRMKDDLKDLRLKIQREAKDWVVRELRATAAQKSSREEKKKVFEAARPFLVGCPDALKELEKAINESLK